VLKSSSARCLLDALRHVAAGGTYVDPGLAPLLTPREDVNRVSILSPRERQILDLLAEGLTGQAIAEELVLSPETVRTHVRNAVMKLGARTRVQAVALVIRSRAAA
jgi:DNA-binding NarL/FixJ family response regulator